MSPPPDQAPTSQASPELAALLSWLLPGLGHIYLGDLFRGALFLLAVNLAFAGGLHLSRLAAVEVNPPHLALLAQVGCGGWTVAAGSRLGSDLRYRWYGAAEDGSKMNPTGDVGWLYTVLAGLLNFLVIQDAYYRAARRDDDGDDPPDSPPDHPPESAA